MLRSALARPIAAVYVNGRSLKKFSRDMTDLDWPTKLIPVQVNYHR